jgi:hypothetical protein
MGDKHPQIRNQINIDNHQQHGKTSIQVKSEVYIHFSQIQFNSVSQFLTFNPSRNSILGQLESSLYFKNVKSQNNSRDNYLFQLLFFHHIPSGSEMYMNQILIECIAFKLFNLGQTFWVAFHKLPTISWVNFGPDRAGVTELGL